MARRPAEKKATTSAKILEVATRLFAENGYDGTSTKQICDAAGVNIAAIHYHFGSKETLYRSIIEDFGRDALRSGQRILEAPSSKEELRVRLKLFIDDVVETFLRDPDRFRIVHQEVERLAARSEDVFRRTFIKRFELLVDFLSVAKKRRLLASDIEPRFAAFSLLNQLAYQTRSDCILNKFHGVSLRQEKFRAAWAKHLLQIYLDGVLARS